MSVPGQSSLQAGTSGYHIFPTFTGSLLSCPCPSHTNTGAPTRLRGLTPPCLPVTRKPHCLRERLNPQQAAHSSSCPSPTPASSLPTSSPHPCPLPPRGPTRLCSPHPLREHCPPRPAISSFSSRSWHFHHLLQAAFPDFLNLGSACFPGMYPSAYLSHPDTMICWHGIYITHMLCRLYL